MQSSSIVALDIGGRRIGVALANSLARLASPLTTLEVSDQIQTQLHQLFDEHQVSQVVVGLPRNMSGEDTDQTRAVREFVSKLQQAMPDVAFAWQDEALTSQKAEQELQGRGKPYAKGDIDALAATYILEDYLRDNPAKVVS